ncbi:hypothetical protein MNBD_ALPHA06-1981, partial [hydrothermal vent metagenome]
PGPILSMGTNLDVWNSLTPTEQLAIRAACGWANTASMSEYGWRNQQALKILVEEHGVQMRGFSDDIWRTLAASARDVLADVGNTDASTKAIYQSYMSALTGAKAMTQYAEGAYLRVRAL